MQDRMIIPFQENYNKIWQDYKISFFNSYSSEKWREELIDINSITYEFIKEDVESLFYSTGGYLKYLDFESIYRLAIEVTSSQIVKNIKKHKKLFFEKLNVNNMNKFYIVQQRICNNCKNVFDSNRKINVVFLQSMIIDTIYENYEIDLTIGDIQKILKTEPSRLILAINGLLNNYDLNYDEILDLSVKYNINLSNFSILNLSSQFKYLKKSANNQIIIDFESEVA